MDDRSAVIADQPRGPGPQVTFGGRRGRMSPSRRRALDDLVPGLLVAPPVAGLAFAAPPWAGRRLIVEIGCGRGDATASMAPGDLGRLVVACEPNTAVIAHLALLLDAGGIDNVRLWVGDAFELLSALDPGTVAEIRVWFPDPWPKSRHATRRLVAGDRVATLAAALEVGGRLRLATDDDRYAEQALAAIADEPRLVGAVVSRPPERPVTVFEARAHRGGRSVVDIVAERTA